MKKLTAKQQLRNSLEMAIIYNNCVESINELLTKKEQAEKRKVERQGYLSKNGGKKACPAEALELDNYCSFINSFSDHGCIMIDGRSPQNKGMKQFLVCGKATIMGNTLWNLRDLEHAYKFLLHSVDFNQDLRLKDNRTFKCYQIRIMFVQSIDSSNRPLTWKWVNWDGINHEWIWAHNEGLTFNQTVENFKSAIAAIKEPGNYDIIGMPVYVRSEDLDFVPKSGMNYNLRKVLSAINNGYVGVNNWAE